jgi:aspartyl/asparaginyl beta-hydroxylase (cupin superfamily)
VTATISTSPIYTYIQHIPRLHNLRTNWSIYRNKLHVQINLHISLRSCTEATDHFSVLLQEAAQQATPTMVHKKDVVNIPLPPEGIPTLT